MNFANIFQDRLITEHFRKSVSAIYSQFRILLQQIISQTYFLMFFTFFRTNDDYGNIRLKNLLSSQIEVIFPDKKIRDLFASQKCLQNMIRNTYDICFKAVDLGPTWIFRKPNLMHLMKIGTYRKTGNKHDYQ